MLPSHLGSSSSLTQWLVSSSEVLPESASSPRSQLPQIRSLPSLIYSVAATSSPGRLTSSLPLTPHSIPLSSPPEPQDQPTHCSTAKQAPNPPTTPGFPKSSPKTLKWPSRPINLHPTNHHPSQDWHHSCFIKLHYWQNNVKVVAKIPHNSLSYFSQCVPMVPLVLVHMLSSCLQSCSSDIGRTWNPPVLLNMIS